VTQPVTTQSPALSYILCGGDRSPGVCVPHGFNSPRGWDERQGYAMSGATLVPKGNPLASGVLEFRFFDESQFPDWYAFAGKYFSEDVRFLPGSRKPRALAIYHPVLAAPPLQYDEFVVDDCTQLEQDEETGLWTCEVKLRRYRKPVPAPERPSAAIPAAQQPQPTAQDAADRMIQELQAQLAELAK
jgi:hypothetical protein